MSSRKWKYTGNNYYVNNFVRKIIIAVLNVRTHVIKCKYVFYIKCNFSTNKVKILNP